MKITKHFPIGVLFVGIVSITWGAEPSWSATTIYGPKKFIRATGKPVVVTETFSAPSATAHYKLLVLNGDKGQNLVSSATIKINGIEILRERDFDQRVDRIERSISLQTSNNLSIELKSAPGGSLTIMIECLDCLDISISSPPHGAIVSGLTVLVKGTIIATTDDVGVTVNGFPALLNGTNWAVLLPLSESENTITAKITDSYGNSAQKSINIYAEWAAEMMSLSVSPVSGVLPLLVNFSLSTTLTPPPVSYQVDFGDGITISIQSADTFTHTYSQEGIYYPTVIVTDSQGNPYTVTALVHVQDKAKMDAFLRARWDGMRNALYQKDIPEGLNSFLESSKEVYRQAFNLIIDELPQIVADMQDLGMIYLRNDVAKYRINRIHNIEGTFQTITYYIYFTKDSDGIWRIDRF